MSADKNEVKSKKYNVAISADVHHRMKIWAVSTDTKIVDFVEQAILEKLERDIKSK